MRWCIRMWCWGIRMRSSFLRGIITVTRTNRGRRSIQDCMASSPCRWLLLCAVMSWYVPHTYSKSRHLQQHSLMMLIPTQQHYAVWGDVNGPDDPKPLVGEASLALATACFGRRMNGNNGHGETDMLYIAFAGLDAVPGADGAKWDAKNWKEFETSLEELGDQLVQRIGAWDGR